MAQTDQYQDAMGKATSAAEEASVAYTMGDYERVSALTALASAWATVAIGAKDVSPY